jgi:exosome complex RNA-binding protein Rrp42 (RNase PH superfamily)
MYHHFCVASIGMSTRGDWQSVTESNVVQIGRNVLVGCTLAEQAAARGVMHVAVDGRGRVCGLVTAGKNVLETSTMQGLITAAQRSGRNLFRALQRPLVDPEDE